MKRILISLVSILFTFGFILPGIAFAATTADVTVTATPTFIAMTNSPGSKAFGAIAASSTVYAKGSAPANPVVDGNCTFTITNTGSVAEDFSVTGFNFTGGVGWTLAGAVGTDTVKMVVYYSGEDPASGVVLTTGSQAFISSLAAAGTKMWDFSLSTGTFTDGVAKSGKITLTATAH